MTRATDEQVTAWAARHDLGGNLSEWRVIFEDAQTLNQCDGCRQRAEIRNGLHYDEDGKAFMACQRARYASAAAPAAQPVQGWQRIGTAPRDGTNILLRFGEDGVSQGKFVPGLAHPWKFIDTNDGITWLINHAVDGPGGPSHWQPMPSSARPAEQPATPLREVLSDERIQQMRLTLLGQVQELIDVAERHAWTDDAEEKRRTLGAIEHARKVTAPYNFNGALLAASSDEDPKDPYGY